MSDDLPGRPASHAPSPSPPGPRSRRLALAGSLLALLLVAWLGGLVWFAGANPTEIVEPDRPTDAAVVLTGGSGRLDAGLALLAQGKARKLFVSGVYRGVEVAALLHMARNASADLECCITLGHTADSTLGNALETAAWMAAEHQHSLRLVTGAYHMPRSLLEFRRVMPDVVILANPVFPERVKGDWWRWPGTAMLVIEEYDKYLLALARGALLDGAMSLS
jgi:uncharacterized SAM-binding protein YcdF (DUF218 family)